MIERDRENHADRKIKKLTVRMDEETHRELKVFCARTPFTMNDIVIDLIKKCSGATAAFSQPPPAACSPKAISMKRRDSGPQRTPRGHDDPVGLTRGSGFPVTRSALNSCHGMDETVIP